MNMLDKDAQEAALSPGLPSVSRHLPTYAELKYPWIRGTILAWSTLLPRWSGQYNPLTAYRTSSAHGNTIGCWRTATFLWTQAHSSQQYKTVQLWDVAIAPTSLTYLQILARWHGKSKTLSQSRLWVASFLVLAQKKKLDHTEQNCKDATIFSWASKHSASFMTYRKAK